MALKLGELLVKEGLITPAQLEEALKSQVIFGIKLGSSLIELGYVDETQLVKLLSKKLGVPAVTGTNLSSIPRGVIGLVPAALAEKYRVIPIKLENKRLSVVMSDPTDIRAIDELAFATSCFIQPFIAPDVMISYALEKYYDVKINLRYMRVSGGLNRRAAPKVEEETFEIERHPTFATTAAPKTAPAQSRPQAATPVPSEAPQQQAIKVSIERDNGELLNIEIPAEFEGFGSLPDLPDAPAQSPANLLEAYTVDKLSMDFAHARDREHIADVFIKYLGQEFEKGALFIIRGDLAIGWRAIDNGKKVRSFDSLSIPLSSASVLNTIIAGKTHFLGPIPNHPSNATIISSLHLSPDYTVLALPIIMQKKVVAALLVTADIEHLGKRLQEIQKLVYKASLAFEILINKNKILMT